MTGKILTPEEVVAILDGITAGDLQELAGEFLLGGKLRLAVVGPVKDEKTLEELLRMPDEIKQP